MSKIKKDDLKIGEYYYIPNKKNPDSVTLIRCRSYKTALQIDEVTERIYGDILSNMDTEEMEFSYRTWTTGIPSRVCTPEEKKLLETAIKTDFDRREVLRIAETDSNKANAKKNKE